MWEEQDSEEMDFDSVDNYASTPQSQPESDQPASQRKKRKAWGQPIPEFEKIIGPRKRAKTEAEKTQRAHERTLRNRRAAAHSRDKKQAQFALMEIENQKLREELAQYQARFGALSESAMASPHPINDLQLPSVNLPSYPTPSSDATLQQDFSAADLALSPPSISLSGPVLSQDKPTFPQPQLSPTLAPTLQLESNAAPADDLYYPQIPSPAMLGDLPDAAQYSAVSSVSGAHQPDPTIGTEPFFQFPPSADQPHDTDDDLRELLEFNAHADVPDLSYLSGGLLDAFSQAGGARPSFPADSLFDYEFYERDSSTGLPDETPQPTSRLQPDHRAPNHGCSGPSVAASSY